MIGEEILRAREVLRSREAQEADAGASTEVSLEHLQRFDEELGYGRAAHRAVLDDAWENSATLTESIGFGLADQSGVDPDEDGVTHVDMAAFAVAIYSMGFDEGACSVLMLQRVQEEEARARAEALGEVRGLPEVGDDA